MGNQSDTQRGRGGVRVTVTWTYIPTEGSWDTSCYRTWGQAPKAVVVSLLCLELTFLLVGDAEA